VVAETPAITLQLTARESSTRVGRPVAVRVTVVNDSDQPVTYNNTSIACNYSFKVLTGAGSPAPETDFKKRSNCRPADEPQLTGRNIVVTLNPGRSNSEELNVTELYDMSQPGQYSIQVERTFPGIGHFTSNTVSVTVTP